MIDDRGRVFFFWLGWDEERNQLTLRVWKELQPQADWADSPEYVQARETVGLAPVR